MLVQAEMESGDWQTADKVMKPLVADGLRFDRIDSSFQDRPLDRQAVAGVSHWSHG